MMAGVLLARAGIETLVLEKHADFNRDFRGDTVHPSTMAVLAELGWLDRFLERPHNRLDRAEIFWNGQGLDIANLSHLKAAPPYIAMMPQWDFLDFLRQEAACFPRFHLMMEAPVTELLRARDRFAGVRLESGQSIEARRLVLMADGRDSLVRRGGLLPVKDLGVPIDVFWFRVPKQEEVEALRGSVRRDRLIVMIDRGHYWQCAYVIAKGSADKVRERGIEAFRADVRATAPGLEYPDSALPDWDAVKLLSVSLDRLTCWHRPGLLAIGDAAHAMSPVGGVGINLAIQDAVATANLLAEPLAAGKSVDPLLHRVQDRRLLPTRLIQGAQRAAHNLLLKPVLSGEQRGKPPPLALRLLDRFALLRRIPGGFIGLGYRREHVTAPVAGHD